MPAGSAGGGSPRCAVQVDNSRDIADLDINLDLMADKDRTVVQLVLTGTLTVTDRAALDACLDKYSRLFAWIGLWEQPL